VALAEWSLTPEHVNDRWSPEILWLMFHERKLELERVREAQGQEPEQEPKRRISDAEMFKLLKIDPMRKN
jgi:hypothetical protein